MFVEKDYNPDPKPSFVTVGLKHKNDISPSVLLMDLFLTISSKSLIRFKIIEHNYFFLTDLIVISKYLKVLIFLGFYGKRSTCDKVEGNL